MLADFALFKSKGDVNLAIEVTSQQLLEEVDIDIPYISKLNQVQLENYVSQRNLTDKHLDMLAQYFYDIVVHTPAKSQLDKRKYAHTAKELIRLAEKNSTTITFERMELKTNIENLLSQF